MAMIWKDKLAIALAFVFVLLFAALGASFTSDTAATGWPIAFVVLWIVLRLIDWVAGGPARRRAHR